MRLRRRGAGSLTMAGIAPSAAMVTAGSVGVIRKEERADDLQPGEVMATEQRFIRVEVSEQIVERLLAEGRLCAADVRCLDCRAKQCLWRMALDSCRKVAPRAGIECRTCLRGAAGRPGT